MNRRRIAARLSLIVALSGLLPIAGLGVVGIEVLRRWSERAAQDSLEAVSHQVAARLSAFLSQQQQLVRAVVAAANGPEAERRLAEVVLDAPTLARVTILKKDTPERSWPRGLSAPEIAQALSGSEVFSEMYLAEDTTPAVTICMPAPHLEVGSVCAQVDLLEMWRFVQRLRVGESGYALAFDSKGRLLASGAGQLRAAILDGSDVPQSNFARAAASNHAAGPTRYIGPEGEPVLAAWAQVSERGWTIVVEQPLREATAPARAAQWTLLAALALALALSMGVGIAQSQRVLGELEIEERWRTAGRIAAGIAHDLGHRLRALESTSSLAAAGNPEFLPRIAETLRNETTTLKKFVADFSDLSRDLKSAQLFPLELNAFLASVARTAQPYATSASVSLQVAASKGDLWVKADRHLLERAVLNLVSNAIEASPRSAAVRLSAARLDGRCLLEVVDQGPGIAPERLPKLFDAFTSTKRTGAHIGMGLPNVKRITEALGGAISVESLPGAGSTFRIALPASAPPQAPTEPNDQI